MGGSDSNVVVTDLLLDTFTVFNVASTPGQNIYVTWVEPVPEPALASLLGMGILAIALDRRTRGFSHMRPAVPNQAAPANAPVAPRLQSGHFGRRVTAQRR